MSRLESLADNLLRPLNPTIIIILGLYTATWGLWVANPFWTVFTQAPIYLAMAQMAPEIVWGAIAVTAGIVISYGAYKPSAKNLQLGAFVGFFHWFVIGILYLISDWQNTGGITSLTFAIYSALVWVNVKINRKHYG